MAIKFADAKKDGGRGGWIKEGFERVSARDLVGKEFEIIDVDFVDGNFGETGVVYLKGGKAFLTSSSVLVDQLKNVIQPLIEKGETVIASIGWAKGKSGRRYLTFL